MLGHFPTCQVGSSVVTLYGEVARALGKGTSPLWGAGVGIPICRVSSSVQPQPPMVGRHWVEMQIVMITMDVLKNHRPSNE